MSFCIFWGGNKDRKWARCKLAITTLAITFMICNKIFWSVCSAKICCLDVIWAVLPCLLIIYPFQRKQNPLRRVGTVLQMHSYKCWSERNNYFLQPTGCTLVCIVQKVLPFCAPGSPSPFLQNYFPVSHTIACTGAWDFSSQKAGFGISLDWTSWGFIQPICPVPLTSILLTAPLI